MKNTVAVMMLSFMLVLASGCGRDSASSAAASSDPASAPTAALAGADSSNPLLSEFQTPFGVPPFDLVKPEHFVPALEKGMADHKTEVAAIVDRPDAPTFANTVEALDRTGALLVRVRAVFSNLVEAHTNDALQKIDAEMAPVLAKHADDIAMNPKLFARVKAVYDVRETLTLTPEQSRLLEKSYKAFVRAGVNLPPDRQARLRAINEELSVLSVRYGDHVLQDTNAFELVVDNAADLAGLPPSAVAAAAETAKERGKPGTWIFTLHKPSLIPFLTSAEHRGLREKMFRSYIERGNHGDAFDNKAIAAKIAALRFERAGLLGYKTHADYVLEESMAKNARAVTDFLQTLWAPALRRAKAEASELQALARKADGDSVLRPWDWWFYAEKLRKEKYDLDDSALRPYFSLENVRNGAYSVATRLFGITFTERTDIPVYHPDVRVFEVRDAAGAHLGILYVDYYPRASKRAGAWMSNFREQKTVDGRDIRPVIVNCGNFSKPAAGQPALISYEEAMTLFHEFGHALHGLLARSTYESLSGTNVPRDFVELPSQIMENWAGDPQVLKDYARHYQTGEPIPDDLVAKIQKSRLFNQGFETVEYLAASILDMDWHTLTSPEPPDTPAFEAAVIARIGLIPEIVSRYRSTYFNHIFSGGYSAGYYSYIWAEVLDADAFQAFREAGIFDPAVAASFRTNILERGGTEDPMVLYKRFRGREPKIESLLKKRGLD